MKRNLSLFLLSIIFVSAAYAEYQYDYFSDRVSREFRDGYDLEDWIERGNATVTASPRFADGVRLTAWAGEHPEDEEEYEFAIASAIYHFEVPSNSQYIEILVRYRGESTSSNLEDYEEIAGRVWIRNTKQREMRRRQDDGDETRYGDTFILRAKRRAETIKIPAANHVKDGLMELHVVVDGSGQVDVESISVLTYQHQPEIRVVERHIEHYPWQSWHRYSYLYFYDGPIYYTYPGHYLAWHYPIHNSVYLSMRRSYGRAAHWYYNYRRPPFRRYRRQSNEVHIHLHNPTRPARNQLSSWSEDYEQTRRSYTRGQTGSSVISRTAVTSEVQAVMQRHRTQPTLDTREIKDRLMTMRRQQLARSPDRLANSSQMRTSSTTRRGFSSAQGYTGGRPYRNSNVGRSSIQQYRSAPVTRSSSSASKSSARAMREYQQSARQQQVRRRSTASSSSSNSSDENQERKNRSTNNQRTRRR